MSVAVDKMGRNARKETYLNRKISFQPSRKCGIHAFQRWIGAGVIKCQATIVDVVRILTNNVVTIQNVLATIIHQSWNFPNFVSKKISFIQ